jgi:type VI secretion system secreted protein Hcp
MADTDFFLKIKDIPGESRDKTQKDAIEILSWSWGVSNAASDPSGTGGLGAGKASVQDLHVTFALNKACIKLMNACATGAHLPETTVLARRAGGEQEEYLNFKLERAIVSSYQEGASNGGDSVPTVQMSINFEQITMTYKPQKQGGKSEAPVVGSWDKTKMKK